MEQKADSQLLIVSLQNVSLAVKVTSVFSRQDTNKTKPQSVPFCKILNEMNPNIDSEIK